MSSQDKVNRVTSRRPGKLPTSVGDRARGPASTALTGAAVCLAARFSPIRDLEVMVSIGTLLALVLV